METALLIKSLVVVALLLIVASLGVALFRLQRERGGSTGTVRALTIRIALSIVLFLLLVVGYLTGVIVPHGVVP
ncbi:MAG: twin transmembrane helix small protein [Rhodocyclales bacterium]|nr:twin transmembrane helix small protein [Rhodocyclales bacterium]